MGYPLSSGFFSAKGSFLKNWGGRAILSCREYKNHVRKELIRTRREEEMTRFFYPSTTPNNKLSLVRSL
jgi:hypothetical protein